MENLGGGKGLCNNPLPPPPRPEKYSLPDQAPPLHSPVLSTPPIPSSSSVATFPHPTASLLFQHQSRYMVEENGFRMIWF